MFYEKTALPPLLLVTAFCFDNVLSIASVCHGLANRPICNSLLYTGTRKETMTIGLELFILSVGRFHTDAMVEATCTILSTKRWETYTVITTTEFSHFPCDIGSSPSTAMIFIIHCSENGTQISSLNLDNIYNIRPETYLNVIAVCSSNCIIELLRQEASAVNVGFHPIDVRDHSFVAYWLETNLSEQNKPVMSRWLVIPTVGSVGDIVNTRVTIKISEVVILEATLSYHSPPRVDDQHAIAKEDVISFVKLYSMSGTSCTRKIHEIGAFKRNEGLETRATLFPRQKYGFHNKSLTVAVMESPPFVFRREIKDSIIFSGASIDLLKELSRRLNFSYNIVEPEDGEWGAQVNGTWTGLIGMLVEKKADLVVAPLAVMKSREDVIDFTVPYFYTNMGIIIRTPSATTLLTLISPFHYNVHICIAISVVWTTAFFLFMAMMRSNRPVDKLRDYGDAVLHIFGALMAKGSHSTPSTVSSRILLSAWLLFTMVLAATYSGNLTASMTDGRQKLPFSNLAELVQQDTYRWGLVGRSFLETLFKDSNRSEFQATWQGIESNTDGVPDADNSDIAVHLRRVLEGRYAFIGDETIFKNWLSDSCDLQFVKEQFFLQQAAVGLPNNSAYTKIFSNEILQIYEKGLVRHWYDQWMTKNQCEEKRRRPYRVNLLALQSLFYVCGVCVVLAGFVLVAEIMYCTRCHKGSSINHV